MNSIEVVTRAMAEPRGTPWKHLSINIAGQPRLLRFDQPAQKLQSSPESAHTSSEPLLDIPLTPEQPLDPTTPTSVRAQPLPPRLLRFSDSSGPDNVDITNSSGLVCSNSSSDTNSEEGSKSTTSTKMDTAYRSHMQQPQQRVHYEPRKLAPIRVLNNANSSGVGGALLRLGLQTGSTKPLRCVAPECASTTPDQPRSMLTSAFKRIWLGCTGCCRQRGLLRHRSLFTDHLQGPSRIALACSTRH